MKSLRNPSTVHAPLAAYSHQVEVSGPQRWMTLSGQIGMLPDGRLPDDPVMQLQAALDNLHENLASARMDVPDVVKLTFYIVGAFDPAQRHRVLADWLGGHKPCMPLVHVAALASPEIRVEIDAAACAAAD